MMTLTVEDLIPCIAGAVSIESTARGLAIHRSATRTREQLADPFFDLPSGTLSGVRIEMDTDAEWVELDLELTRVVGSDHQTYLDLVVDGQLVEPVPIESWSILSVDVPHGGITVKPAGIQTFHFDLGTSRTERQVQIWLPHAAKTELTGIRAPEGANLRPSARPAPVWVHYGSSISQCMEVARPTQTWPVTVARQAGLSLVNLGLSGQCHLDQGMARTICDLEADAVSIEVGINIVAGSTMHERTFTSAFHGFLDTVREGAPNVPVLIVTPIYCGALEEAPGPIVAGPNGRIEAVERPPVLHPGTLTLTRVRQLLEEQVATRQQQGDARLHLTNGLDLFGADDERDLPDGLHPNSSGYGRIASRFYPVAFGRHGVLRTPRQTTSSKVPPAAESAPTKESQCP